MGRFLVFLIGEVAAVRAAPNFEFVGWNAAFFKHAIHPMSLSSSGPSQFPHASCMVDSRTCAEFVDDTPENEYIGLFETASYANVIVGNFESCGKFKFLSRKKRNDIVKRWVREFAIINIIASKIDNAFFCLNI